MDINPLFALGTWAAVSIDMWSMIVVAVIGQLLVAAFAYWVMR